MESINVDDSVLVIWCLTQLLFCPLWYMVVDLGFSVVLHRRFVCPSTYAIVRELIVPPKEIKWTALDVLFLFAPDDLYIL